MTIQNSTNLTSTGVVTANGDGTFSGNSLSQYSVLLGGSANAIGGAAPSTSGYALLSNGASANPSFQAILQAPSWVVDSTTSRTLTANQNVAFTNAALVTATLPATAAVGDTFLIMTAGGAGGVQLAQANGQTIHFLGATTTVGISGYLQSLQSWSWARVVCIVANTTFSELGSSGS